MYTCPKCKEEVATLWDDESCEDCYEPKKIKKPRKRAKNYVQLNTLIQCKCGGYGKIESDSIQTYSNSDQLTVYMSAQCNGCRKELEVDFLVEDY
jgi:hypothetical protein